MLGAQQTGWLTAAFVIVFGMIELLGTTALTSLFPMMSRYSGVTLDNIVRRLVWFTLLASLPLTLLLSFFALEITVPLFGADFAPAATLLRILAWYALIRLVADVYLQALITSNRQRRVMVVYACGLLLNVSLNAILLPRMGVNGAAIRLPVFDAAGAGPAALQHARAGLAPIAHAQRAAALAGARDGLGHVADCAILESAGRHGRRRTDLSGRTDARPRRRRPRCC